MKILEKVVFAIVVIFAIISFIPKHKLYYQLEDILSKQKIYLTNEISEDKFLVLSVKNPTIYFTDIKVAKIGEISLFSLMFYSKITINNIFINKHLKQFLPSRIDNLSISHNIFNPFVFKIKSNGKIGNLEGFIDLQTKILYIELHPSKMMKVKYNKILSSMKQSNTKQGIYTYEYKFR